MKASELRTGNILLSVQTGKPIIVDWLVIKHIHDGNRQAPPYDMSVVYEPIPLTEEVLLKCGYSLDNPNASAYRCRDMPYIYHRNGKWTLSTGIPFKYVHEFQNRIYSLTGKELEVRL